MTNYNKEYADMTDTYYHEDTPLIVCDILEESRISLHRIKIHYGDVKTGKPWNDTISCHVGRSTGSIKIPLSIMNSRSHGGTSILDNCIIKIEHANKRNGGVIYQLKQ